VQGFQAWTQLAVANHLVIETIETGYSRKEWAGIQSKTMQKQPIAESCENTD
jgi:hypothetical protein